MVPLRHPHQLHLSWLHGYHPERRTGARGCEADMGVEESDGEDGSAYRVDRAIGNVVFERGDVRERCGYCC